MTTVPPPGASVVDLFLALVATPSPSGRERAVAGLIAGWLAAHGIDAALDEAGAVNGSDAGNLIATLPGAPEQPAYLFIAHMDTVESGAPPVTPRITDGVIRSAGDTILGADNKSAVAAVMRLCAETARVPPAERPTVIAAFTCREESGRMGASLLGLPRRVDCAFCVDGSRPIGTVITRALGQRVFSFAVRGRAAHAAANPEAGINAVRVAAEAIATMPLGRQAHGGSATVAAMLGGGVIDRLDAPAAGAPAAAAGPGAPVAAAGSGAPAAAAGSGAAKAALDATPTNSIPDLALVRGEVRGYSESDIDATTAAIRAAAAAACDAHGARLEWDDEGRRMVPPFPGAAGGGGLRALAVVRAAVDAVPGITLVEEEASATLEANYLAASTDVVAVASGGRDPHQTSESIAVAELQQLEALLLAIVRTGG